MMQELNNANRLARGGSVKWPELFIPHSEGAWRRPREKVCNRNSHGSFTIQMAVNNVDGQ